MGYFSGSDFPIIDISSTEISIFCPEPILFTIFPEIIIDDPTLICFNVSISVISGFITH